MAKSSVPAAPARAADYVLIAIVNAARASAIRNVALEFCPTVVLVRDGFHPVVAGHGYNVYYLNCLAGSARQLSNTEDPDHVWVRSTWKQMDPRVPLVKASGV